jgi:ATP-dependent Lhr-like helicase
VYLGRTPLAVIDVETTGFAPDAGDRVVEIAIVTCAPDGTIEEGWVTLINPLRPVSATNVHGISNAHVRDAPTFRDVAGDIAQRLRGRVLAAHNARFDLRFLDAEYELIGVPAPQWPVVCTLQLSKQYGAVGGRLAACCESEGIVLDDAHSALADATATARLLALYLERARHAGVERFTDLGSRYATTVDVFAPCPPSGRVRLRPGRRVGVPTRVAPARPGVVPAPGHAGSQLPMTEV